MEAKEFREVAEAGEVDKILALFADDAELHSPITFVPFEGKEAISRLIGILVEVFEGFHYTDELHAEDGRTLAPANTKLANNVFGFFGSPLWRSPG